jgi:hypothetical protein
MSISVDEVHASARALALGTDFEAGLAPQPERRRDGIDPRRE